MKKTLIQTLNKKAPPDDSTHSIGYWTPSIATKNWYIFTDKKEITLFFETVSVPIAARRTAKNV